MSEDLSGLISKKYISVGGSFWISF